jgi:hypothetical protein
MAPAASKVFISYNRADRDWAEWIASAIESAGYEPIIIRAARRNNTKDAGRPTAGD